MLELLPARATASAEGAILPRDFGGWKYGLVHSGDLPHPSARHCHLVSIGSGAIGGRRRPSQCAGLRDQFSVRDQLRHKRRVSPRTALMRQRRPPEGRHNWSQCASGAGSNAADFGNRHRKIQGPSFASFELTYAGDAKFLGAPRRRPPNTTTWSRHSRRIEPIALSISVLPRRSRCTRK
jgi:hypothetical protein